MDLPQPPSSTPSLGSDKFLQRAHELKEAGNIELRKGRMLKGHTASKHSLTEACVHYAQGLQQIEMAKTEGTVSDDDIRTAILPLYLNLSAANLMLEEWELAEACCDAILQCIGRLDGVVESTTALTSPETNQEDSSSPSFLHPTDASVITACKALYRRGQAKAGDGRLDEALVDLRKAVVLCPRDRQIRCVYSEVKAKKQMMQAKEDLKRETELGTAKRQEHLRNETQEVVPEQQVKVGLSTTEVEATARKGVVKHHPPLHKHEKEPNDEELRALVNNGGIGGNGAFKWSQTISHLHLTFALPQALHSSNMNVILHRKTLDVSYDLNKNNNTTATRQRQQHQSSSPFLGADDDRGEVIEIIKKCIFSRPICVDESTWMLEKDGHRLVIDLCKELVSDGPEGFEWWSRVLQDDEDIDMGSVNAGMDLRDYPEHTRQKLSRALWHQSTAIHQSHDDVDGHKNPSSEVEDETEAVTTATWQQEQTSSSRKEQEEEDLMRQLAKEEDESELLKDKVLKDPKMDQLYRSLKEKFPDTDILFNKHQS